jgi:ADP-ribose pyrophosphatase
MPDRPAWLPEGSLPHEELIATERGFDGRLLHVRVDTVRLPSGRDAVREIVDHPGSVVIVPVTTAGTVLLIQQYRYAVADYLLELPAGLIDPGEDAMTAAARELEEETGYRAASLSLLADVFVSPGYTRERTRIVLARDCAPIERAADADEPIELLEVPLADIDTLLTPGSTLLRNMQAMLGLMWLWRTMNGDSA